MTIAILSMGVVIAIETNYKNQFSYLYSIALLLMLSFAQIQTAFYGEALRYFCRLTFNRKMYYLENILMLLIVSGITSIVFFIGIVINKIAYNKSYWLYLIVLVFVAFLEYYIGKKLFMKKDID